MSDKSDDWGPAHHKHAKHIHAIGEIVTSWTNVEEVYLALIQLLYPANTSLAIRMFELLGNESRWSLIRDELVPKVDPTEQEHLLHFLKSAAICKENRNAVAHAKFEVSHIEDAIRAVKGRSKDGQSLRVFNFKLDALRQMADEIAGTASFGFLVWTSMVVARSSDVGKWVQQMPLPAKPPLPRKWDLHSLEEPPAYQRQPPPSEG